MFVAGGFDRKDVASGFKGFVESPCKYIVAVGPCGNKASFVQSYGGDLFLVLVSDAVDKKVIFDGRT